MAPKPVRAAQLFRRVDRRIQVASIACGAAENLTFLIASRVVQGAFGGGLLATAQAILRDSFPPDKLGASQGIFALGAIIGPTLGPPLGGLLVDNASWNWVFDINIVPGIFASVVLLALLRDPAPARSTAVDLVGLGLLAAGLGSLQYVLTEGERHSWLADPVVAVMTVVCVVSLAGFGWYELHGTNVPVVDCAYSAIAALPRVRCSRSRSAGLSLARRTPCPS